MEMLINESAKAIAKAICRHLSPAGRAIVVRDSIPMEDLAANLPRHQLTEMLLETAQKLNLSAIRVIGEYGEIEGSPSDRTILRRYALSGTWSPRFQAEIIDRAFKSSDGTLIDVGANIGLTAIPAAKNHSITCLALEPDPVNFDFLRRNIEINGMGDKIKPINIAAYDGEAVLDFELSPHNLGDHRIRPRDSEPLVTSQQQEESRKVIQIKALPLDMILATEHLSHPLVMKIDTQGSEPMVFRGATEVLQKTDCLVVEFSPYTLARAGFDVDDFFRDIRGFSYGYILSLDDEDNGLTIISSPPLEFDQIVEKCRLDAPNRHPDNYYDLVLLKQAYFLS
jgi:FkbM family methyltransferase